MCPCVGSAVAEVVGRLPDPEKRSAASRVNIARRTAGRDGGLARSNLRHGESQAGGAAGEGAARAGIVAETHVTASRNRNRLTHVRGCPPAMEGTSGRRERLIFTERRRKRPWQSGGTPGARARGRSLKATGVPEVRLDREHAEDECRAPTRGSPPKRIRRRETPGSPVPWPRVQARLVKGEA